MRDRLARQQGHAGQGARLVPRPRRDAAQNVSTDIPAKTLPPLAELAAGVQLDRVTSLGFVPPQFERASDPAGYSIPDVVKIRAAVRG